MAKHPITDDLLDSDIAILAKKGKGKTYTAKGIVERLLDEKARVLVLDPLSMWWGLRSSADGERAGYPIAVFGGEHGDMELSPEMAEPLAKIIARDNFPAIMDISVMKREDSQRFVAKFLAELFRVNRDPLYLVLEEAHVFAPQAPNANASRDVLAEVDRIARMGRAYGFRLITITQRAARLNKDVLTQASTLVAMGTTSEQDRGAIEGWIKGNGDAAEVRKVIDSLASLQPGEAWIYAPDHDRLDRVKFPTIKTLDNSATPKRGEKRIEPKTLAQIDLSPVLGAVELAQQEKEPKAKAPPEQPSKAREEGYKSGKKDGLAEGVEIGWQQAMSAFQQSLKSLSPPTEIKAAKTIPLSGPNSFATDSNPLVAAAQRIWPLTLPWTTLCMVDGRKARGGHFNTLKKAALESGQLKEVNGRVVPQNPPDIANCVIAADLISENLPPASRSIFEEVRKCPGFDWSFYADALGRQPRGGHWNSSRKVLMDGGLIEVAADGGLSVRPDLLAA